MSTGEDQLLEQQFKKESEERESVLILKVCTRVCVTLVLIFAVMAHCSIERARAGEFGALVAQGDNP